MLSLEGSASIRAILWGNSRCGGRRKAQRFMKVLRKQKKQNCATLDTEKDNRRASGIGEAEICGPSKTCLRHPPPWMGYAGRDSETESALLERGRTLGHRRLFSSGCSGSTDVKQGRSSRETLQRSQLFARLRADTKTSTLLRA